MTTVTRTLYATPSSLPALRAVCDVMAFVRADLWRRYGALGTVGKSAADIRREVTAGGWYANLAVDGTIRAETTKNVVNDILTYKAAACAKVRQAIAKRAPNEDERKRMFALPRADKWLEDRYLHRMMRKHFRHGVSRCDDQFVVRADKHESCIVGGRFTVTIRIAKQYGEPIVLTTTSSGKNVDLTGCNLRVILKGDSVEVHYATGKTEARPCGTAGIGVDKGYTEAFTDSDGARAEMFASARLNGALPHGNLDGAARTPPKFNDPRERGGLNRPKPWIMAGSSATCSPLTAIRFPGPEGRATSCMRSKRSIAQLAALPRLIA